MITGIDVLSAKRFDLLRNRRVGLLSHQAALTANGATSAQLPPCWLAPDSPLRTGTRFLRTGQRG